MNTNIESHLVEKRVFKPSKEFVKGARIGSFAEYKKLYAELAGAAPARDASQPPSRG